MSSEPIISEEEAKEGWHFAELLCLGNRFTGEGKKVAVYWSSVQAGDTYHKGHQWSYSHLKVIGSAPGAVYRVYIKGDLDGLHSIRSKGDNAPQFIRMLKDTSMLADLQLRHRQTNELRAARTQEAKVKNSDHLFKPLEPLRQAYMQANRQERAALLMMVMRYIMGGL